MKILCASLALIMLLGCSSTESNTVEDAKKDAIISPAFLTDEKSEDKIAILEYLKGMYSGDTQIAWSYLVISQDYEASEDKKQLRKNILNRYSKDALNMVKRCGKIEKIDFKNEQMKNANEKTFDVILTFENKETFGYHPMTIKKMNGSWFVE